MEATTTVSEIVNNQPERITVVTNENFSEYVDKQLGVDPVKEAEAEAARVEEEKAARIAAEEDPAAEFVDETGDTEPEKRKGKKEKLNERFSELTAKRKEAEEKAAQAAQTAREAQERAEAVQRERDELRAKYEPPKTDELGAKPELAQFQTTADFEKALEDWTSDKIRIEDGKKRAEEQSRKQAEDAKKAWDANLKAAKEKHADFDSVMAAAQDKIKFSDEAREAIFESNMGPEILRYYALPENHDASVKLGEMTVKGMLKEIGRLEEKLADKPQSKAEVRAAEMSKAPPPITPLKGGSAAVGTLNGYDEVPKNMSYDDWKKWRQAGKIH